ncbi:MAG TPA: tRNA (adenosine(37)-N6)-dimethylallyltransferase MiaA [Phenylobacterium sp.]|jgi:tRNA dimethylallyltransferase|uniref:tRNA (adenosine(37)-N6)-dimethylallyltransferase MiaA n=1 Tax=Phenylobacterium sp. TaxID=1871053 RepID=UPI002D50F699|nr:tRNA (adenosine(37)-N6)-dimethylallyltransferase MiaA [Phenylobacterium sp.]HZZ67527.1 tRNA (adenosine(37)-N6)-dimethylallyltransferase MiaA [Phenylobacterium sp.]
MEPRIWLIAGPTASGKSALALRLAKTVGGEIVNADSMQLYADLRLLTARPSPDEETCAPHHLFGTVDAADGWSVGRWLRAALPMLDAIAARGRPAIVAGGTGLYFKALTQGLAEIPQVSAEVRAQAGDDYDRMGEMDFRGRLGAVDPAAAARIAPGDRQRLVRAWEVFAATETPLSDWQSTGQPALAANTWRAVGLEPPRAALYARCDARLAGMVEAGVLDEVRSLMARNLDADLPLMKAVGVRELSAHLRGETTLPEALTAAQQQTRNYAKRQTTWMRGQMAGWPRLDAADTDGQWRQFLALNPALTP